MRGGPGWREAQGTTVAAGGGAGRASWGAPSSIFFGEAKKVSGTRDELRPETRPCAQRSPPYLLTRPPYFYANKLRDVHAVFMHLQTLGHQIRGGLIRRRVRRGQQRARGAAHPLRGLPPAA